MTKEYEDRKKNGKTKPWVKVFEIAVSICVCIVGFFFLLMVIFPQGGWVELFRR